MTTKNFTRRPGIFFNCRFDEEFLPFLQAIIFTVMDCGFHPRCALEQAGSQETRLAKLLEIIAASPYCITDISLSPKTKADSPRLNMAFELGLFMGRLSNRKGKQAQRSLLVMDSEPFRYQHTISDLAGVDIQAHGGDPLRAIAGIREWLRALGGKKNFIPPAANIQKRFTQFIKELRVMMRRGGFDPASPLGLEGYLDYVEFVRTWLRENERSSPPL